MSATFLIDKSAFARRRTRPEVGAVIDSMVTSGQVATCGIVDLEVLYSARDPSSYADLATAMRAWPRVPLTEAVVDRALAVQGTLAKRSQHRGAKLPDLLIAACAESAGLTVLHYDADFDLIAEVTGQPMRWVVPRGSVA
ncbi:PIN domain nuclease [Patulibacter defluvii]|uniref:PIN domain nuclease n=1 Tax=Patulibacter defluvii TaxID=3095358 RepID=UPI002A765327|nr:PIN domain nuclease [Patulibacter sp. DM4]